MLTLLSLVALAFAGAIVVTLFTILAVAAAIALKVLFLPLRLAFFAVKLVGLIAIAALLLGLVMPIVILCGMFVLPLFLLKAAVWHGPAIRF